MFDVVSPRAAEFHQMSFQDLFQRLGPDPAAPARRYPHTGAFQRLQPQAHVLLSGRNESKTGVRGPRNQEEPPHKKVPILELPEPLEPIFLILVKLWPVSGYLNTFALMNM